MPNDEALSGGPYLRVALVAELDDLVPVNATSLFAEWESALDPIRELRTTAARYLPEDDREWLAEEKYVVATFWTPNLLRAVAKDEAIHDAFRSSLATIRWPGDMTRVYRELKALAPPQGGDKDMLDEDALPLLLGLAVASAIDRARGLKGFEVSRKRWQQTIYEGERILEEAGEAEGEQS